AILGELAEAERRAPPTISEPALALLASYRWPGNVRELRHVLARALHAARDVVLPEHVDLLPPPPATEAPPRQAPTDDERARIVDALTKANGNQKEAARLLGMTRRML